jgi:hypothetical protein
VLRPVRQNRLSVLRLRSLLSGARICQKNRRFLLCCLRLRCVLLRNVRHYDRPRKNVRRLRRHLLFPYLSLLCFNINSLYHKYFSYKRDIFLYFL